MITPFDVCGELPTGTTVLEASAGTGKTFTIAALATRYVAEGRVELGQLMMVTFGRMATDELRLRVRERMVSTADQLAAVLAGGREPAEVDSVARLLLTGDTDELTRRHARLARALSEFDAATIATTHEFCLRMLDGLGVLGDREPHAVFVEHLSDLTAEVAGDVYLRRYAIDGDPPMQFDEARRLAQQVINAGHTRLVPTPDPADGASTADRPAQRRIAFAAEVRAELQRRKDAGRLFTYDDMLTRLRGALAHPENGEVAAARLRDRYRVVLVDEFQDTDPVQWEILRRSFHGHSTLVLIGDPKQAIYAFRGADVFSYLDAVRQADQVATLGTNWRTDAAVCTALDRIFDGASLGDPAIAVRDVHSHHQQRRLLPGRRRSADCRLAPFRLRVVPREVDPARTPSVNDLRPKIEADLVTDITALLDAGREIAVHGATRELVPSDIAVLVRKNSRGESIRDALVAAGVPAVMLGTTSVFASPVAQDWLTLLGALEQPRQALTRQAALTCFLGWSVAELAQAGEPELTALSQRVRWWSRVLASRGVAALLEAVTVDAGIAERLLTQVGGERTLTDLRHIGQALHGAMSTRRFGISALVEWLREQVAEAAGDALGDGTRRLETDAEAVQILTLHRSKGLEFPVVYLPEAWDQFAFTRDEGQTLRLHLDGDCVLDVGGRTGPGRQDRLLRHQQEESGEELRLLYVGLTRAQCQVVTWWAASANTPCSALHRLLFRDRTTAEPERSYPLPEEPVEQLDLGAGISVEAVSEREPVDARPSGGSSMDLATRSFERPLDLQWRRTSYSALTAPVYGLDLSPGSVASEVEIAKEDDETAATLPTTTAPSSGVQPEAGLERASPMQDLPSGTQFGTVVHAVLEHADPQTADLAAELRRAAASALSAMPPRVDTGEPLTADRLAEALLPVMRTPLGPLAAELRLCDISVADRLSELTFELPLAGGEHTTTDLVVGDLVPLLRRHLAADDPLAGYPDLLAHPSLAEQMLRGYLTGSIDAVLRIRGADGPRYLVVDYKTNWLGQIDGPMLTVGDYVPARLTEAMLHAHYPLQALLYQVALHRTLRWRQRSYSPDLHLGGVLYLFVRGMAGPDTPRIGATPCGVFSWRPAPDLVVELSDLLDTGPVAGAEARR